MEVIYSTRLTSGKLERATMADTAYIVTDLSFGDAGKGTTVDYLVRQAKSAVVVRHNGGPQAAHNVITPGGRHHTFSQFASGSFVPGVLTHLSRFMLVNPLTMFTEAQHLLGVGVTDIWERLSVEDSAKVITPWHRAANRLRELSRGDGRHGSTGHGVGETMADSLAMPELTLYAADLAAGSLEAKLRRLRDWKYEQLRMELGNISGELADLQWEVFTDDTYLAELCGQYRAWAKLVQIVDESYLGKITDQNELVVFEGAQGVLLDEWFGFHPYTTWSTTTHANALELLAGLDIKGPVTRLGVIRAYTTRHGPGPFVTEDPELTAAIPDYHNGTGQWQGAFRIGHLDLVAHQYALDVCSGADELVVTGLDRLWSQSRWKFSNTYELSGEPPDAERFFQFAGGKITGIKLGTMGDLDYQGCLTELLMSCKPLYQTIKNPVHDTGDQVAASADFLRQIEEALGLPIGWVSFGPTANDKRLARVAAHAT